MGKTLTKVSIDAAVARARVGERVELADDREPGLRLRAGEQSAKWSALVRLADGRRVRVPLGSWPATGIADARKAAQAAKGKAETGANPNAERRAARDGASSLRELVDTYAKAELAQHKRGAATRRAIEATLKPFLTRDAVSVTRRDVARVIDKHAQQAPIAANRNLAYVKAFFAWAVGRGHLVANPAVDIAKPSAEAARARTPTLGELVEIWNAAGTLGYPFGHAVRLLMLTAMRREEITAMQVDEIHLPTDDGEPATWTLPAARSKNGRAIRVPISPLARAVLVEALRARPSGRGGLVFTTTGATPVSGWSKAKARLDAIIAAERAKAALDDGRDPETMAPWRIHDLRRGFATLACDVLHVDPAVADRCLNHVGASTTSTISRVYGRSEMFDQRKEALTAWADLLDRAIHPRADNIVPLRRQSSAA